MACRCCSPAPDGRGGTWNRGGDIRVRADVDDAVCHAYSAAGGAVTPVTRLDPAARQHSHRWPQFLPDGRRFLFLQSLRHGRGWRRDLCRLARQHRATPRRLLQATSNVALLGPRHLVVTRERSLIAQPIEPTRRGTCGRERARGEHARVPRGSPRRRVLRLGQRHARVVVASGAAHADRLAGSRRQAGGAAARDRRPRGEPRALAR